MKPSSIESPHSREKLKITRKMFNYLMTRLQIPPSFVEFVLPFGRREFREEFPYSGFRNTSRLPKEPSAVSIPQLNWSGRQIEISYSLMSVELYSDPKMPEEKLWSIRMCSVYHAFDTETGKTTWVSVKGNRLIRTLLESHFKRSEVLTTGTDIHKCFRATLKVHLLLAQWSAEYWHSYISHIQETLQEKTRHANSISLRSPLTIESLKGRTQTLQDLYSKNVDRYRPEFIKRVKRLLHLPSSRNTGDTESISEKKEISCEPNELDAFSFNDLQDVQALGDKATEAMVALRSNRNVLSQLSQAYSSTCSLLDKPSWRNDIDGFVGAMSDIVSHIDLQKSNADTLLTFINERKTQVCTPTIHPSLTG